LLSALETSYLILSGSEKNRITFKTRGGAEKAGYKPSKNCEGL
jgi:hypothetical protein